MLELWNSYGLNLKLLARHTKAWSHPKYLMQLGAQHVEDVLSRVSEQVSRLAASVSNVSGALELRATRDELRASGEGATAEIAALTARVAALEKAVTVRCSGSEAQGAAELVAPRSASCYA